MTTDAQTARVPPLRVASVSYVNARPLIEGLDDDPGVALSTDVPSRLIDRLRDGRADVALLPVIDYQRHPDLRLIPAAGGIACDGPTLTVRIFSRTPIARVASLACDPDSHTSVALARVVLAEQYGARPELVPLPGATAADAQLLIGDKVVCEAPTGYPHDLDLGAAWRQLTGLPFVFAAWTARAGVALGDLPDRLARARVRGLSRIDQIVLRHAVPRGWPAALARAYLTRHLEYHLTPRHVGAIRLFHAKAAAHGLIDAPPRPLVCIADEEHGARPGAGSRG